MSLLDSNRTDTLPKLLQRNAEESPTAAGIREKSLGVWQTLTWVGYRDQVRDLALGLAALDFKRGDKLSVVGDNRPQLYIAQLAAQGLHRLEHELERRQLAGRVRLLLRRVGSSSGSAGLGRRLRPGLT